jgi:hypothetical protein
MPRYLFAAPTVAAILVAAGCHGDASRGAFGECKPSGCFGCTDSTQTSCWPLPYGGCKATSDCKPNEVCTSIGCCAHCDGDGDCRPGEVCTAGGYCAPGQVTPTPVDDGHGGGSDGGAATTGSLSCAADGDCRPGETCVARECTHSASCGIPATLCAKDADCGANRVCSTGTCRWSCGVTGACPIGQGCSSGVCFDVAPRVAQCVFDLDCGGAAARCIDATCHPLCSLDRQCGRGEFCDLGVCRADVRPVASAPR